MRTQVDQGVFSSSSVLYSLRRHPRIISGPFTVGKIALYASTFQVESERHNVNKESTSSMR